MQPVARRLNACVLGGEKFVEGATYISSIDPEGNRHDFCPACWEQVKNKESLFWRGSIPCKKKKQTPVDLAALEAFRTLTHPKHRFVLALYLQRKQQLLRRTATLYELAETGEVFDVPLCVIDPEESSRLALEIEAFLFELS